MVAGVLMEIKALNNIYNVIIIRKYNKNTYIRLNNNMEIIVTTSYLMSNSKIKELLNKKIDTISKMILNKEKELNKLEKFYYKGREYDIIIIPSILKIEVNDNKIFAPNLKILNKWYKNEITTYFNLLLLEVHQKFQENIPHPILRIRKMKTRWGVCNRKTNVVTLNTDLMRFSEEVVKYVIIHELVHFIYFDHSKKFWNLVAFYCPNYKKIKKIMKN